MRVKTIETQKSNSDSVNLGSNPGSPAKSHFYRLSVFGRLDASGGGNCGFFKCVKALADGCDRAGPSSQPASGGGRDTPRDRPPSRQSGAARLFGGVNAHALGRHRKVVRRLIYLQSSQLRGVEKPSLSYSTLSRKPLHRLRPGPTAAIGPAPLFKLLFATQTCSVCEHRELRG